MPKRNPFTASFGVSPPVLVGRDDILEEFADGLDEGPGSPERASFFSGVRGVGKTVMLNAVEELARERGWLTVSTTALPGFVERLVTEDLPPLLREHHPRPRTSRVTGASLSNVAGFTRQTIEHYPYVPGLSALIAELLDVLEPRGAGLLITVDEVHRNVSDELVRLGSVIQHLFREDRQVAIALGGLPGAVSDLLSDEHPITFIRRASRYVLGEVDIDEVRRGLRQPVEDSGKHWDTAALEAASQATGGYPFLIQLVGTYVWRVAQGAATLTPDHADRGIARARRKIGQLVHEPALQDLSATDRSFLVAMAVDDGVSRTRDVADRLGVQSGYVSVYRARLIAAGMVRDVGHGRLELQTPFLRDYLREHAASLGGKGLRLEAPGDGQTRLPFED